MFTASLNDAKNLKYIMESMSDLVDEAIFFLRKDMMRLEACDPSLVCKIELDLQDTFFNEYLASEDRTIGLSMSALRKISRRIHLGDGKATDVGVSAMVGRSPCCIAKPIWFVLMLQPASAFLALEERLSTPRIIDMFAYDLDAIRPNQFRAAVAARALECEMLLRRILVELVDAKVRNGWS